MGKYSALLEVEKEEQIPTDADHSMICKFETDTDDIFEKVYKRMGRMRREAGIQPTHQTDTPP